MKSVAQLCTSAIAFAAAVVVSATAWSAVPPSFRGCGYRQRAHAHRRFVCRSAPIVSPLVSGKDSQVLGGIEMAGPGFFPPNYRGIMAVLITEFSGQQPATVTFNLGEKKGVAQLEFAPVQPGSLNAQGKAYNAHITKLSLAKRFALHQVLLKKCVGEK